MATLVEYLMSRASRMTAASTLRLKHAQLVAELRSHGVERENAYKLASELWRIRHYELQTRTHYDNTVCCSSINTLIDNRNIYSHDRVNKHGWDLTTHGFMHRIPSEYRSALQYLSLDVFSSMKIC